MLLTPSTNEAIQGYVGSGTVGTDQSLWVAASYGAQGTSALVAHLDTLGQPISGRSVTFQAPAITSLLAVDALPDGGAALLGGTSTGQPLLARLAADGTTTWSKQLLATPPGNFSLFASGMVAVGADALVHSLIGGSEFAFGRVKADGTAQAYNSYQLPAHYASSRPTDFKALPGGQGAVFVYQTAATTFLLANLNADGQLQWLRQLSLADLPPAASSFRLHLAVAPTSGNVVVAVVPLGLNATGTFQVVRLSATGTLLSAANYALADNSSPYISALALDAQERLSWTAETTRWLYYYAVDAQGNPQVAKQVSVVPTYPSGSPITLSAYGVVRKTARYAYALGTLAGPAPANAPTKSLNFLAINADGQAGCQLADAPGLLKTAVPGTQATAQALPAVISRPITVTNYSLANTPFGLQASQACP